MDPIRHILFPSNYASVNEYLADVKKTIFSVLKYRVALLGLTVDDLNDINAVKKYEIGRDDKELEPGVILQKARIMGITLIETIYTSDNATITCPVVIPDYALRVGDIPSALEYIANMPQKPKDDKPQT